LATQSNHIARDKHSKNIVLMIPRNLKWIKVLLIVLITQIIEIHYLSF
jgi:hypothetical protein